MSDASAIDAAARRGHAETILRGAIAAADPGALVSRALHGAPELSGSEPIRLLAVGKAATAMAAPVLAEYGARVVQRLLVLPHGAAAAGAHVRHGAHPLPDAHSEAAGRAVVELLENAGRGELIVALLSGGGSAVAVAPLADITIGDQAECIDRLMKGGADIGELNIVRKHIDALKGGRMALRAAPAATLCLVLSDVVGDAVETVASGPFSPDPTTCEDALRVLRRHARLSAYPRTIIEALEEAGAAESVKPEHPAFEGVRVRVVGGNDVAMEGAARAAEELGYRVHRAVDPVTGLAREAGCSLAREALHLQRTAPLPLCIVAGGETTVAVTGTGRGGRNQELVLAACIELHGAAGITVGSIGTDGVDGPTEAAGAVADENSAATAAAAGVAAEAALRDNDSHAFHAAAGGLLVTGPTGTNVNDVQIALVSAPAPHPLRP